MNPSDDRTALALTMVGEARGEGLLGMGDVGCTIRNRVALQTWFGLTAREVALKPYQYSCWNNGDPNRAYLLMLDADEDIYREALGIADDILDTSYADTTHGATHYYRIGTPTPAWAVGHTPCFQRGHHLFFTGVK